MSLSEAIKGAQLELAGIANPVIKLRKLFGYGVLLCGELWSQVGMIPYGIRAYYGHHTIARASLHDLHQRRGRHIALVEDVKYGAGCRNKFDIYLPAVSAPAAPVALFCHGGVWAHGERWHYAPMATRLAQAGVLTMVMSYSLYPKASAAMQAAEVNKALSWSLANIDRYGGDPAKISLVGHSAGAHLGAMALLHRVASAGRQLNSHNDQQSVKFRMPASFIGIAGVYDISQHFDYERRRGVEELSTMKRAMGGAGGFAAQSPNVLVARALHQAAASISSKRPDVPPELLRKPALLGEALSRRIGFERPAGRMRLAAVLASTRDGDEDAGIAGLSLDAIRQMPPVLLMSSLKDLTVPWYESAEFYWLLHDCGVPAKHLCYLQTTHGEFVTKWRSRRKARPLG